MASVWGGLGGGVGGGNGSGVPTHVSSFDADAVDEAPC